jgi:hypothetical protein
MIPTCTPHPLKSEVKKARLRLWEIQKITGIDESQLSRMLNGIITMTPEVETGIRQLLDEVKQPLVTCK